MVKGLDRLLTRVGMIVTGTHDPVRARDQLLNKFYAVALVDADTPTPGGGIELLQFARDKSPLTSVVIMTARKSYETAVRAFRAGAADVVLKEPDVVPYLRERVVEAATDIKATADRNSLLEEVAETHEEFLRRLRDVAREGLDLEDRLPGARRRTSGDELGTVSVVLVDDDPKALEKLSKVLTGGGGLAVPHRADRRRGAGRRHPGAPADRHGQGRPARSARQHGRAHREVERARRGDAAVHAARPQRAPWRGEAGRHERHDEHDRELRRRRASSSAPLGEIREALRAKSKERRYLQAFRQRHFEFLQRYNSIKNAPQRRARPPQEGEARRLREPR